MVKAAEIAGLPTARDASNVVEDRWGRSETWSSVKARNLESVLLERGEWDTLMPDQTIISIDGKSRKKVINSQNLAHDALRDFKNLVAEAMPSFTCPAKSTSDKANSDLQIKRAALRSTIATGYREFGSTEALDEILARDLALFGMCLMYVYATPRDTAYGDPYDYPQFMVVNPMGAYPTWFRGELLDCLWVERVDARVAQYQWRSWFDATYDPKTCGKAELIYLCTKEDSWQVLSWTAKDDKSAVGQPLMLQHVQHEIEQVPVAWAAEFGSDRQFEGMLEQSAPPLAHRNRLISILTDGADRATYGPLVAPQGTDVSERGPDGVIFTPVGVEGSYPPFVMSPARADQSIYWLASDLERSARGTLIYPQARAGQASQSIISAAGVNAFQGERNSGVLWAQRHLTRLWTNATQIAFAIDEKHLNFEKDLITPVEGTSSYLPSQIIDGQRRVKVTYGGMGVDVFNATVNKIQLATTGLASKAWARRQITDIENPLDMEREIEMEQGMDVWFKTTLASLPPEAQRVFFKHLATGLNALKAIDAMEQELSGLPAPGAPQQPGPEAAPIGAADQQLALQKGAQGPPGEVGAPPIALPTLDRLLSREAQAQVFVK